MSTITDLSASAIVNAIKIGEISAVDVAKKYLKRIEEVNPSINAIVQATDPDMVMAQAALADQAVKEKSPLGPLHGLPITIKDCFQVTGMICSGGCKALIHKADSDATVVSRLRAAGAIILGLTNVPELLLSVETDNSIYGRTNNPHDLERTCGGSSGGEGAIIAAGGSPLGLGTDAGGSIRIPAHFCGVAGIKPTHGLIPLTGSILGDTPGIFGPHISYGPLARHIDDLSLCLSVLAGPDGRDPRAVPSQFRDPALVDLSTLRIGYYTNNGIVDVDADTSATVLDAVAALQPCVKSVEESTPEALKMSVELLWDTVFLGGDQGQGILEFLRYLHLDTPSLLLQKFIDQSKNCKFSVSELRMRLVAMDQFNVDMLGYLNRYDAIICPVAATPAKKHGTCLDHVEDFSYTMSYNLCGAPAVVVPFDKTAEGLPIGVQVVSRRWRDDIALAVAKRLSLI